MGTLQLTRGNKKIGC